MANNRTNWSRSSGRGLSLREHRRDKNRSARRLGNSGKRKESIRVYEMDDY